MLTSICQASDKIKHHNNLGGEEINNNPDSEEEIVIVEGIELVLTPLLERRHK